MTQKFAMIMRMLMLLIGLAVVHAAEAQPAQPQPPKPGQPQSAKPAPAQSAKPAAQTIRPPKAPAPPAPKAPPRPRAEPVANSGPCSIGVISHLGGFSVQKIGLMVFGNELKEVPVPAWGLDDLVVARVRAAAGPRAHVRKIAYAPEAFVSFDRPERMLFRNVEQDLASVVQAVAKTGGCERYVVVVKSGSQFSNTNQTVNGIGVLSYVGATTYLFALTAIRVYDGRSFAVLKRGVGGGTYVPFSTMFSTGIRGPSREVKGIAWPPTPDTASLRDDARSLLAESLDKAMPELLAR